MHWERHGPVRRPHTSCKRAEVVGEATTTSCVVDPKVVSLTRSGEPEYRSGELGGVAAVTAAAAAG
uniref:Uncharacterized protein n=1 Tax=Oryza punctata TaxID=4537 RepID=A0A0E0LH77_ORYPU